MKLESLYVIMVFNFLLMFGLAVKTHNLKDEYFRSFMEERSCRWNLESHIKYLGKDKIGKEVTEMIDECTVTPYKKGCKCEE